MVITQALAQKYASLIESNSLPWENDNPGSKNTVFYTGAHAIKVPHKLSPNKLESLTHEKRIAEALQREGINVPEMHGVYDINTKPFLIMQRLRIVTPDDLRGAQRTMAKRQYEKMRTHAERLGFTSQDLSLNKNYGFDPKQNEGFFFDFADWEIAT